MNIDFRFKKRGINCIGGYNQSKEEKSPPNEERRQSFWSKTNSASREQNTRKRALLWNFRSSRIRKILKSSYENKIGFLQRKNSKTQQHST